MSAFVPVAERFLETARRLGPRPAVIRGGETTSFDELARDAERLSGGLLAAGLEPGERVALLVPPSRDLYALTFGLFRAGLVPVFVDPGIGFANMGRCLAEAEPAAFIGSPKAHLARLLGRWAPSARVSLAADGAVPGLRRVRGLSGPAPAASADRDGLAAILFTSGSTGAPKGVEYSHGTFAAQVDALREMFAIEEGEVSVPTFPLFGLFDAALGQTCVLPDMDFTRPGFVDPAAIVGPLQRHRARQLFGSPALLDRVGRFGERHGIALPDLRRVMSAGAPVPARVLARFTRMLAPGVPVWTPYGATEALPVALIGSDEILAETAADTALGRGTCVGRPAPGVEVAVIRATDEPIARWSEDLRVPPDELGEIVVKGPAASRRYFRRPEADALAKIADGGEVRHRMGDLGRLDSRGRLWFCGRKSQRVRAAGGDIPTEDAEGVFNALPAVRRSALVGVGRPGEQTPVLCVEREPDARISEDALRRELLARAAAFRHTRAIERVLFHPSFPVDARHNAKIFREKLAAWAERELAR